MARDTADALVDDLRERNPWWERGVEAFSLPERHKSDFYHLVRPDEAGSRFEDQPLFGLVGRRGVGKTTLVMGFIHGRIAAGADPRAFVYLPFAADPRYQLRSDEQLRRVLRYYENRILGRDRVDGPHFVLLDDVNRIEHPAKPTVDGWGTPVAEALAGDGDRHVVVTASADVQVTRELERAGVPDSEYAVQPILPEKFRDFIFSRYPALEADEETRISPTSLRTGETGLPQAIEREDATAFVDELRTKRRQVRDVERRIQSHVGDYLAMGGILSYATEGPATTVDELDSEAFTELRRSLRDALYQEIPGFESIKTIDDLERLCALAAENRGREPIRFRDLVEWFDVDRRTIADRYLPALSALYILTGVTEYDNARPRSVRLFLRDTGLVTALSAGTGSRIRDDLAFEADLARVAAFDHSMRFAYNLAAVGGRYDEPSVQYWRGRHGEVDFVFEVDGTAVPVGLAYRPGDRESTITTLREFMETYDAPIGLSIGGDPGREEVRLDDGIVELPYWLYMLLC